MDERGHQQIDPAVLRLARFKGRQLAGKYGFARHDAEDIEQELLLDYWRRSRSFDSHRCSSRGFGRLVVNNRIAALIEAQMAACRDYRACGVSIDQAPDQNSEQLDIRRGWRSPESQLNLRLDIERVLMRLPPALVAICRLLMVCDSFVDAAARAGISRATLYRRLRQVHDAFVEAGWAGAET